MSRPTKQVAEEVSGALASGMSVVALESTLIAHGLPWPDNLETARQAEAAVREAGAVPATIAVLEGVIQVGLDADQLERLATRGSTFPKVNRRDLGLCHWRGTNAATTVSATLWVARSSGIGVMATGGLGGVHRGASETRDVSNDLDELARADGMLVVCSGVKSILDIPATLEELETRGIATVAYGTDEFPAFTTPGSGLRLEWSTGSPEGAASMVRAHRTVGVPGAIVLAQPVDEAIGIPREVMEAAVAEALADAAAQQVTGKAITPFLLDAVRRATEGRSLTANRALIVANARLAAQVAVSLGRS